MTERMLAGLVGMLLGLSGAFGAGPAPASQPARADEGQFKPLFNGKDLSGWRARSKDKPNLWFAQDGALVNSAPGTDLITEETFDNFELLCECKVPSKGRGGLALRGRYEIRIADDSGSPPGFQTSGAIRNLICPGENAALGAWRWQTLDVTVVGKTVTVVLNGRKVIPEITMPHPTPDAIDANVDRPGPVLLRGGVDGLSFRNLRIKVLPASTEPGPKPFAFGAKLPPAALLALDDAAHDSDGKLHHDVLPEASLRARLPFASAKAFNWCDLNEDFFVHNQGPSSSCWANTAIEALECNWLIRNGIRHAFSPQPVLDHTQRPNGGASSEAFDVLLRNGTALMTEYPFAGQPGKVRANVATRFRAVAWGSVGDGRTGPTVEQVKAALLEHGPLAVDLFVTSAFMKYGTGVFAEHYKPGKGQPAHNHEVLLLGWDDKRGRGAWYIKNSWGEQWGQRGYCWIEYGCNNICYDAWWVKAQSTYYTLPKDEFAKLLPGAAPPMAWTSPLAPIVEVKALRIEHNVVKEGRKGVLFHVAGDLRRAKDKKALVAVYILGNDGKYVSALDKAYAGEEGRLRTASGFVPREDDFSFKDIALFLPFSAVPLQEGKNQFRFKACVCCEDKWLAMDRVLQGEFQVDHRSQGQTAATQATVKPPPIKSQSLSPSNSPQTLACEGKIKVTVPGGLLKSAASLTISSVDNSPPPPAPDIKTLAAYDISLGDKRQLSGELEIELPVPADALRNDCPPEAALAAGYFDPDGRIWVELPTTLSADRKSLIVHTNHLCILETWFIGRNYLFLPGKDFGVFYNKDDVKKASTIYKARFPTTNPDIPGYVSDIYEFARHARDVYELHGLKPYRLPLWIIVMPNNSNPEYTWHLQRLFMSCGSSNPDVLQYALSHEMFHAIQHAGYYRKQVAKPEHRWWLEATAEYASSRMVMSNYKFMGKLDEQPMPPRMLVVQLPFFGTPQNVGTITGARYHQYQMAHFIEFVCKKMRPGDPTGFFVDMYKDVVRRTVEGEGWIESAPVAVDSINAFLVACGKDTSLDDMFRKFAVFYLLSADSPMDMKGATPGQVNPKAVNDRLTLKATQEQTSPLNFTLGGCHTAEMILVEAEVPKDKPSRDITVEMADQNLPPRTAVFICKLPGMERAKMEQVGAFLTPGQAKESVPVSLGPNDQIAILAVNDHPQAQDVKVIVKSDSLTHEVKQNMWGHAKVEFSWQAGAYKAGMLWLGLAPDGKNYKILQGQLKAYNANGKLEDIHNYKDGLPDGPFQTWWDNGQLQSQGRCEKGKLVAGTWKVFDRDGKPSTSQKTGVYPGQ